MQNLYINARRDETGRDGTRWDETGRDRDSNNQELSSLLYNIKQKIN
jgi:hypothetical protein